MSQNESDLSKISDAILAEATKEQPRDPRGDFEALQCDLAEEGVETIAQFLDDFNAIDELLDTGSVTVGTSKGNIVFTLHVKDERK